MVRHAAQYKGTLTLGERAARLVWCSNTVLCLRQDSIAGPGRRGTRAQCVTAARRALVAGRGCLIDRCNFDATQRRDFIALAQELQCQVCFPRRAVSYSCRRKDILTMCSLHAHPGNAGCHICDVHTVDAS